MVDIIRRKNARVETEDVSAIGKATSNMINQIGSAVEKTGTAIEKSYKEKQAQKQKEQEYQNKVQENIEKEQEKIRVQEQKAYDAADKLVASDRAGRLKNDLLRWNNEQREKNPNFVGSAEHEKAMRDQFSRLASKYGVGLGDAGKNEFTSKTQNAVNEFIGNDIKWSYQRKLKQAEQSARDMAETMNQNAKLYGSNGDAQGFKESYKEIRNALRDYIEGVAPSGARKALREADTRSIEDFIIGLAESDPYTAKSYMEDKDFFKQILPEEMVQNVNEMTREGKMGDLNDTLAVINFELARGVDSGKRKKLEKLKNNTEKELREVSDKDYTDESVNAIRSQIEESVKKTIDYNINLREMETKKAQNQQRIENSLAFMDNPILYRANLQRAFPNESVLASVNKETLDKHGLNAELDKKTREIYSLADKVGNGKVDPQTMSLLVRQVASITADDETGIVDNNILKAYDGEIALRKAGANPEQLQSYHRFVQAAMTDTDFKQSVAALANKTDFNTMFLDKSSRDTSLRSWFSTAKDDDTDYVENLSRQAYFGAMNLMYQGDTDGALAYYDGKVAEAYDYIKRDIIDVDYVKKELAKNGSAMVELNGRMTKITGRLPNGEYIVESTGEKVNGNF